MGHLVYDYNCDNKNSGNLNLISYSYYFYALLCMDAVASGVLFLMKSCTCNHTLIDAVFLLLSFSSSIIRKLYIKKFSEITLTLNVQRKYDFIKKIKL